jgi:hypothetical protein
MVLNPPDRHVITRQPLADGAARLGLLLLVAADAEQKPSSGGRGPRRGRWFVKAALPHLGSERAPLCNDSNPKGSGSFPPTGRLHLAETGEADP